MTRLASLWFGVFGGMFAWAAHLVVSYFMVGTGCSLWREESVAMGLVLTTIAAGLLGGAAFVAAWRCARDRVAWRRSFAVSGVLLNALGIAGIALAGSTALAVAAC